MIFFNYYLEIPSNISKGYYPLERSLKNIIPIAHSSDSLFLGYISIYSGAAKIFDIKPLAVWV